ncbi:hypothetical protein E1262_17950 [Jiangella aurantiaca]|uniref:Uncharacterized protein n=1 Tax=Jiangella aurantiaca TaxID=2530373 RepID=A0A4R5A9K5_9ACTN|nr:hypothetical protein [Jiangella aurantiaca]TDD67890.1 hypothetical protein E1262_17950 [Jiangella aurantiaca]
MTNSDLAFDGTLAYAGNSRGFRVLDISEAENPVALSDFVCNGSQGDVSVYGGLLFRSVDTHQSSTACTSVNVTASTPGLTGTALTGPRPAYRARPRDRAG